MTGLIKLLHLISEQYAKQMTIIKELLKVLKAGLLLMNNCSAQEYFSNNVPFREFPIKVGPNFYIKYIKLLTIKLMKIQSICHPQKKNS